ncbi:MAG TPA: oligosaccharide flippase family protein [Bacteroidota bacterium]
MKLDWTFLRWVGLYAAVVASLIYYPISELVDDEALRSIVAAGLLSLLYLLLGYVAVEFAYQKKNTTFLKIVLGGMVARLFVMTGVVLVLLAVYAYDAYSLMLSLLAYYVVNLVLEIYLLQKKVAVKNLS